MNDSERRVAILSAATEVFRTKGFTGTTTAEIARLAKVSKRDLYRLFPRKADILVAMVRVHSETLPVPPELGRPATAEELLDSLRRFGAAFVADLLQPYRISLYRLAATEAGRATELGRAIREGGAGPVEASTRAFMTHAVAAGVVDPADADLAMRVYFGALIGQRLTWMVIGAEPPPSAAEITETVEVAVEAARRVLFCRAGAPTVG